MSASQRSPNVTNDSCALTTPGTRIGPRERERERERPSPVERLRRSRKTPQIDYQSVICSFSGGPCRAQDTRSIRAKEGKPVSEFANRKRKKEGPVHSAKEKVTAFGTSTTVAPRKFQRSRLSRGARERERERERESWGVPGPFWELSKEGGVWSFSELGFDA